jgi:TRAP-type C4-dicarboxylate transport system permease small subunit
MKKLIQSFDQLLERLSRWGLISCLFVILFFAVLSIILRWLGMSPLWIEPLTRHVVFLSAFLGGSLATSKDVHIKVDILTHLIQNSRSRVLHWLHKNIVSFFCFVTCLALLKSSWDFYLVEKEFGAPSFLEIHSSWLVFIIPFGVGLISLRFFNRLLLGLVKGELSDHTRV